MGDQIRLQPPLTGWLRYPAGERAGGVLGVLYPNCRHCQANFLDIMYLFSVFTDQCLPTPHKVLLMTRLTGGSPMLGTRPSESAAPPTFKIVLPPLTRDFVTGYVKAPITFPPLIRGRRIRGRKRGPAVAGASTAMVSRRERRGRKGYFPHVLCMPLCNYNTL